MSKLRCGYCLSEEIIQGEAQFPNRQIDFNGSAFFIKTVFFCEWCDSIMVWDDVKEVFADV